MWTMAAEPWAGPVETGFATTDAQTVIFQQVSEGLKAISRCQYFIAYD